ncbi:MAG: hypothetical protein AAF653_04145 [Chloroflexota bacterium]
MEQPPTLPELPPAEPTQPHPAAEPPVSEDDTQPRKAASQATQPKKPGIIPPPPGRTAPPVVRKPRKKRSRRGVWGALGIALLLSVIIALVALIVLLVYTPEYFDAVIPGRLETRTVEAVNAQATANTFATREAAVVQTQVQAEANAAATATAVIDNNNRRATQDALNAVGTALAIQQTATGAAVAFDSTRTVVALQAEGTQFAGTAAALQSQAQGTESARNIQATLSAATVVAQEQSPVLPRSGSEASRNALPTIGASRFNVYFVDDFEDSLDLAWQVNGNWQARNGTAFSTVCGTSMLVGNQTWRDFVIDVTVDNPTAQFAVTMGYGDAGRLYVNFGPGGAVSWLVENATAIPDETRRNVYTPASRNTMRVIASGPSVSVFVDGFLVAERTLPEETRGQVGLYTCPNTLGTPIFERFEVLRIPE